LSGYRAGEQGEDGGRGIQLPHGRKAAPGKGGGRTNAQRRAVRPRPSPDMRIAKKIFPAGLVFLSVFCYNAFRK